MISTRWACLALALLITAGGCGEVGGSADPNDPAVKKGAEARAAQIEKYKAQAAKPGRPTANRPGR